VLNLVLLLLLSLFLVMIVDGMIGHAVWGDWHDDPCRRGLHVEPELQPMYSRGLESYLVPCRLDFVAAELQSSAVDLLSLCIGEVVSPRKCRRHSEDTMSLL
jgi:hypothetical protein